MKTILAVTLILTAISQTASAEGPAVNADKYLTACQEQGPELAKKAAADLADIERLLRRSKAGGRIDAGLSKAFDAPTEPKRPIVFRSKKDREEFIASAADLVAVGKSRASAIKAGDLLPIPYLRLPLSVGMAGRFESPVKVFQVTGSDSILATTRMRIVGERELIRLEGLRSGQVADDTILDLSGDDLIFVCHGTYSYDNALGQQKTVYKFRPLTKAEAADLAKLAEGPPKK